MWYDESTGICSFNLGGNKFTVMSIDNTQCFCDVLMVQECYLFHEPVYDQNLACLILDWDEKPKDVDDISYLKSIVDKYGEKNEKLKRIHSHHSTFVYHAVFNAAVGLLTQNIAEMLSEYYTTEEAMRTINNLFNDRNTTSDKRIKYAIDDAFTYVWSKVYKTFDLHI